MQAIVYYRLKIIGVAGDIKYSDIVVVQKSGNTLITVYPNPAANEILLSGLTNTSASKVVNSMVQIVLQQKTNASSFSIDVSKLPKGLYFVEVLSTDNSSIKQSFIKQ